MIEEGPEFDQQAELAPQQESKPPEPKHNAGVRVLTHYLRMNHGGVSKSVIAHTINDFPGDQIAMFALIQRQFGIRFTKDVAAICDVGRAPDAVVTATVEPIDLVPSPISTTMIDEVPLEAAPAVTPPLVPAAILPSYAEEATASDLAASKQANPISAADAAAEEEAKQTVRDTNATQVLPPDGDLAHARDASDLELEQRVGDLYPKYVEACREFLIWRFHLTAEQGSALVIKLGHRGNDGPIIGGALNFEVDNFPEMIIRRPKSNRSMIENDYDDNFYTSLPKHIAHPPGRGHVAHVMLNETPVPDQPGMINIGGMLRMHFDTANPSTFVGMMQHVFNDLLIGTVAQAIRGDKGLPIK